MSTPASITLADGSTIGLELAGGTVVSNLDLDAEVGAGPWAVPVPQATELLKGLRFAVDLGMIATHASLVQVAGLLSGSATQRLDQLAATPEPVLLAAAALDVDDAVRCAAARNLETPAEMLEVLAGDPSQSVREGC